MMFLGNVTQLVEYLLLLSHTVLYFVTLDFAGVSECASWRIVKMVQSSTAATPPTTFHSAFPPGHLVIYSQFLYLPALDSFLTSSPGAQASGTTIPYYSHEGPSALDSGYILTICLSNVH